LSQITKPLTSAGPIPPIIATTYTADDATTATPAANNLNLLTSDAIANDDDGIRSTASGSSVYTQLTNRQTGTISTTDATLTTIQTFAMGATPGTVNVWGNVQGYASVGPQGASYGFSGAFLTDGASATEIASEYHDEFETAGFVDGDIFLTSSGNNVLVQVQGPAALSVNWNSLLEFRMVS